MDEQNKQNEYDGDFEPPTFTVMDLMIFLIFGGIIFDCLLCVGVLKLLKLI